MIIYVLITAQQTWNENLHQLKSTHRGNLVTSTGAGLVTLWKPTHGKLLHSLRGQSSITQCLEVVGDQLISVSNNGNVVIHDSFENSVRLSLSLSLSHTHTDYFISLSLIVSS